MDISETRIVGITIIDLYLENFKTLSESLVKLFALFLNLKMYQYFLCIKPVYFVHNNNELILSPLYICKSNLVELLFLYLSFLPYTELLHIMNHLL